MRRRGAILERTFAHTLESGAMRRVFLRLRDNILKRYLVHVAAFNLSLVMRAILGVGTQRELRGRLQHPLESIAAALQSTLRDTRRLLADLDRFIDPVLRPRPSVARGAFSTGC